MTDTRQIRFMDLLERHRRIVLKVASLYCWSAEERRDLVQEITLQLWRAFPKYDETRVFSTWMYRIALNVAISSARHTGRRTVMTSLEESGIDPVDRSAGAEPTTA